MKPFKERIRYCPLMGEKCLGKACAWWLSSAQDCSVPVLTCVLADSTISRTVLEYVEEDDVTQEDAK